MLHQHLLRGSQLDRSTLRQEFEQLRQASPGAILRALVRRHRSIGHAICARRSIKPKRATVELGSEIATRTR
jgi:hypothetical protein